MRSAERKHDDGESGKHDITIGNPKAADKSGVRKAGDTGCARNEPEQSTKGLVERARVIARKNILPLLRSAWLLRGIPVESTFSPAAILFALLPARPGAGSGAGTALAGTGNKSSHGDLGTP
ncbi:MAG: hypothetical protein DMG69_06235 [Acidobacteria bacterium]|nr:MAG: hypothetical protein DMG69_06235 [Acidobacteriota bacterium]